MLERFILLWEKIIGPLWGEEEFNTNMKIWLLLLLTLTPLNVYSGAITCGDARQIKSAEAKKALHALAQNRAQKNVETFLKKKMVNQYINGGLIGKPKTLETTMPFIEIYWCYGPSMPLHSAYYSLYTSDINGVLKFFDE